MYPKFHAKEFKFYIRQVILHTFRVERHFGEHADCPLAKRQSDGADITNAVCTNDVRTSVESDVDFLERRPPPQVALGFEGDPDAWQCFNVQCLFANCP
jgi:hypothetical protein